MFLTVWQNKNLAMYVQRMYLSHPVGVKPWIDVDLLREGTNVYTGNTVKLDMLYITHVYL